MKGGGETQMKYCVFLLKNFSVIPPERWSLNIRGRSGVGKSTFCSWFVKYLSEETGMRVVVVSKPWKVEETKRLYPFAEIWGGLSYALLKRLRDAILVLEDYTLYRRSERFLRIVDDLVNTRARHDRIYTICVGHRTKMEMPASLDVEIAVDEDGKRKYQIREGKKVTSWFDCQWNSGGISRDKLKPMLEAVFKPLPGKNLGRQGGKVNPQSKRQKAFKLFSDGKTNKEVQQLLGLSYSLVKFYRFEWKQQQSAEINTNYLTIGDDVYG